VQNAAELQAVIFDMDGVIIDSEPIAERFFTTELRQFGADIKPGDLDATRGMTRADFWQFIKSQYDLPKPPEYYQASLDVQREIDQYTPELAAPGCIDLMSRLKADGIALGLATSGSRRRTDAVIDILNLQSTFGAVVCGADVTHGKPHPEVFLKTAKALGIAPQNCLVVEDAVRGIEAARAAGMVVVGYTGLGVSADSLTGAHAIIDDFAAVTLGDLRVIWSGGRAARE
jgi:HAD superfamily hydrolase (TIGR01509 family)